MQRLQIIRALADRIDEAAIVRGGFSPRTSKIGNSVVNSANETFGEVEDILVEPSGTALFTGDELY